MHQSASVRFYLKCVDKQGISTTFRFGNTADLLNFVAQSSQMGLAIVDTHMAFYDVELLAPVFGLDIGSIDHLDINLAKDSTIAQKAPSPCPASDKPEQKSKTKKSKNKKSKDQKPRHKKAKKHKKAKQQKADSKKHKKAKCKQKINCLSLGWRI